jgi:hypothetical protein
LIIGMSNCRVGMVLKAIASRSHLIEVLRCQTRREAMREVIITQV